MCTNQKTIVVAEDNLILNMLYVSYLERLGLQTKDEVVYGKQAIEVTRETKPDLIIMDISLEGEMTGIEAMTKIREFSDVPVIYITGNSDRFHREEAQKTGYLAYLTKPIEFEDLQNIISENLSLS